ncbi:MFS transporter [Candidatus Woesearchaeota archaeon]|nr:MFS transporter [Candidatus Woesearchaeota archaeon]
MRKTYKSNIKKLYLFIFFSSMHFFGGILIPFFTDWGNINFTQVMILQSWFMLWIFLLEIPSGVLADYIGRKKTLIIGAAAGIVCPLIYSSFPNFFIFLIGEMFFALSASMYSGAGEALIYDSLKIIKQTKKSKQVFGRLQSFKLAGILVSAPVGSLIASNFGLRAPMFLVAVPLTIAFFIGMTLKEPETTSKRSENYLKILTRGTDFFKKNKILKLLTFDMVSIAAIGYFMIWFYQPMLEKAGIPIKFFGFVHAVFSLSQIIILNNYLFMEKVFGSKKNVLLFSSLITGFMYILGGLFSNPLAVLSAIIIGGGFGLARRPLFTSYMNKYIESSERATVISTISMFQRLVLVIVNPIVGFLAEMSFDFTLILLGILALLFALISRVEEKHLID